MECPAEFFLGIASNPKQRRGQESRLPQGPVAKMQTGSDGGEIEPQHYGRALDIESPDVDLVSSQSRLPPARRPATIRNAWHDGSVFRDSDRARFHWTIYSERPARSISRRSGLREKFRSRNDLASDHATHEFQILKRWGPPLRHRPKSHSPMGPHGYIQWSPTTRNRLEAPVRTVGVIRSRSESPVGKGRSGLAAPGEKLLEEACEWQDGG